MNNGRVQNTRGIGSRLAHWVGELLLWVLALAPGILILIHGTNGIISEKLIPVTRRGWSPKTPILGSDAVGWGWCFVGIGIWALGNSLYWKTGRTIWRALGYLLAFVAGAIGLTIRFKLLGE